MDGRTLGQFHRCGLKYGAKTTKPTVPTAEKFVVNAVQILFAPETVKEWHK